MALPYAHRLQTIAGLIILCLVVLGFIFSVITHLPKQEQVLQQARALEVVPRDFFADSDLTQAIRSLNVPNGVPVSLDQGNLGRSNVFEGY